MLLLRWLLLVTLLRPFVFKNNRTVMKTQQTSRITKCLERIQALRCQRLESDNSTFDTTWWWQDLWWHCHSSAVPFLLLIRLVLLLSPSHVLLLHASSFLYWNFSVSQTALSALLHDCRRIWYNIRCNIYYVDMSCLLEWTCMLQSV